MYFNRKCTHITAYETDATKRLLHLSLAPRERGQLELTILIYGLKSVAAKAAIYGHYGTYATAFESFVQLSFRVS